MTASGQWSGVIEGKSVWTSPDGDSRYSCYEIFHTGLPAAMPAEPFGMLIGRVGDFVFKIGRTGTIAIPDRVKGEIRLIMNAPDNQTAEHGFKANRGSLRVLIERLAK